MAAISQAGTTRLADYSSCPAESAAPKVREDGKHAPVVLGFRPQVEFEEDTSDMSLYGPLAQKK